MLLFKRLYEVIDDDRGDKNCTADDGQNEARLICERGADVIGEKVEFFALFRASFFAFGYFLRSCAEYPCALTKEEKCGDEERAEYRDKEKKIILRGEKIACYISFKE